MKYFRRVLRYLRPYWKLAVVGVLLILLASGVGLLMPWPMKILIDNVLQGRHLPHGWQVIFGPFTSNRMMFLVAVVVAGLIISFMHDGILIAQNYVDTKLELGMGLDVRSELFQHAQRLSMAFHDQRKTSKLMYAINGQADAAARLVMTIPRLAENIFTLIGMFWVTFTINSTIALISLTVVPFLYMAVGYYVRNIETKLMEVKKMEAQSLSIVHEAMSMLRVIVAFCREKYEHRRYRDQGTVANAARVKLTVRQTAFSLVVNMTTAVGTALVLGFGAYAVMQKELTVGDLLVIVSYVAAVYKPLEQISTTIGSLQNQFVSLRIAFNLLDTEPEIFDKPGAVPVDRVRGDIRYEGVSFSYTSRTDTLKEISFEATAGEVIALVGPTGAGKTTLISLLPRLYDPTHGRILVDGRDIRDYTLHSLRSQISIVLQEPLLFSGTIAENIRYGRLEATTEEIIEAARNANAHDFIAKLPDGYETTVGERGVQLSGGERQRISVARAFLKDAPILILDEPTSSIDSKTEAVILDALDKLMVGRTTFMVAHRLSTIRNADKILVLSAGELVEKGTHDELLERGGLYRQLYEMQTTRVRRRIMPSSEVLAPINLGGRR
jgi:ATP-binding cassette subfamily B protein/subfamily B ATP-binding cassette protein MsbA